MLKKALLTLGMVGALTLSSSSALASGGQSTPIAPKVSSSCASIPTFRNTTGYYSIYAAIWTDFAITNNCGVPLTWEMRYTNPLGVVEFSRGSSTLYMSFGTIDDDWAKFSTSYLVTLKVTNPGGVEVARSTTLVLTKAAKDQSTL